MVARTVFYGVFDVAMQSLSIGVSEIPYMLTIAKDSSHGQRAGLYL